VFWDFGLFALQVFRYCSLLFIKDELFLLLLSSSSLHQKLDLGLEVCFVCCSSSPAAFVVPCCVVDLFAVVFAEEMSLRCGGGRGRFAFLNGS
jgi:hypothetical protein